MRQIIRTTRQGLPLPLYRAVIGTTPQGSVTVSVAPRASVSSKLLWVGIQPQSRCGDVRLALSNADVHHAPEFDSALSRLKTSQFEAAILSVKGLFDDNLRKLEEILRIAPRLPVIVWGSDCTSEDAIQFAQSGAFHVFTGELNADQLSMMVAKAFGNSRNAVSLSLEIPSWQRLLIGRSPAITQLSEIIQIIAARKVTILISGETGTGKEVVARAIHAASNRSNLPFVAVNCTALPSNLVESELFGHAKGAFTGAHANRLGRFEQAHRSTIFLDEIGDLPLEAQAKLLRVLQEQEFERLGSSETVRVDVRVVSASNVDLESAVRDRRFREDLYYRLNVVPIHLPPLRERREDIPLLLDHFLEKTSRSEGVEAKQITDEAVDFLVRQDWPGNVRQLEHAVQMAFALSGERHMLYAKDFAMRRPGFQRSVSQRSGSIPDQPLFTLSPCGIDFDETVSHFELSLLNQALSLSGGNKARAADLLRIKRTTLLAKMKVFEERYAQSTPTADCPTASFPAEKRTALLLDSDAAVRKLISRTLERRGYRVLETDNQAEALELFECWKQNISLLISAVATVDEASQEESFGARMQFRFPQLQVVLIGSVKPSGITPLPIGRQFLQRPFSPEDLTNALNKLGLTRIYQLSKVLCA